jgi:hypothetical protein
MACYEVFSSIYITPQGKKRSRDLLMALLSLV